MRLRVPRVASVLGLWGNEHGDASTALCRRAESRVGAGLWGPGTDILAVARHPSEQLASGR